MTPEELADLLDPHRVELHALPGVLALGISERGGEAVVEVVVAEDADLEELQPAVEALLAGAPLAVSRSGPIVAGT